jgi:hypothetical protein
VRFLVDKIALEQAFPRIWFPLVIIISPMLHTHLHLHVALTKDKWAKPGNREALNRNVQVKVKFTLEQTMNAQRGSGGIALLFL